jgi:hypothetical protein
MTCIRDTTFPRDEHRASPAIRRTDAGSNTVT